MPIDNPQDIYNGEGPGTKKNGQREPTLTQAEYDKVKLSGGQNMSRAGASFKAPTPSDTIFTSGQGDMNKYFGDTGVYDPLLTGQDLNLEMGERQSFGAKLARRAANLIPNIAADLIDMTGNLVSLATEWGDERDYQNGLNEVAAQMKDAFGRTYKRSNDIWAIGDPTWWLDNIAQIGEYAGAFAIGGAGIASAINPAVKGLSAGLNLSQKASQFLKTAGLLGTNGLVSYAEGAQAGAQVYNEVYQNQYTKALAQGLDPDGAHDQAKHIAAQSAATTAQLATMLTMGLNAGAYAPYFREADDLAKNIISKRIAQTESMAAGERASAIRGMNASDYSDILYHHMGVKGALGESFKEGAEEFLQQFAQNTGTDLGTDGKQRGFLDQFGELENIIDSTANSEGLLNFVLGAGTGGIQHSLIHNVIPYKRIDRVGADGTPIQKMVGGEPAVDKKGNPIIEKTWVTPRKFEKDFTTKSFTNMRDSLAADFQNQSDLETEFLGHMAKGKKVEAESVRDRMFDVGKLYAVKSGMIEPWLKTFSGIAGMSQEEAQQVGYSTGPEDLVYQERAQQAGEDLQHLQKLYTTLQNAYSTKYEGNQGLKPLVDAVFARQADLYSYKNRLDKYDKELQASEAMETGMAQVRNPEGFSEAANKYILQRRSHITVTNQLQKDLSDLTQAYDKQDTKAMDRLLGKYRAVASPDGTYGIPVKNLSEKLHRKWEQSASQIKTAEETLFNSTDYNAWVQEHPGKSFDEYLQEAESRHSLSLENRNLRAQVEGHRAAYEIAQKNLSDMTDEKNEMRFSRKVQTWQAALIADQEKVAHQQAERLAELAKDKSAASRLQKIELNRLADQYRVKLDQTQSKIQQNAESIDRNKAELAKISRDPMRVRALKKIIKGLEKEQVILRHQAARLGTLYQQYSVPDEIAQEPQPIEEVNGQVTGKDTVNAVDEPSTETGIEDEPKQTDQDFINEILNSGEKPEEIAAPQTIDNELDAMRREIEQASPPATELDPIDIFSEMVSVFPKATQTKIMKSVQDALSGTVPITLDTFLPLIRKGRWAFTQEQAVQLAAAAQKYVAQVNSTLASQNIGSQELVETNPYQKPAIQVTSSPVTDSPVIENTDPESSLIVPTPNAYHSGLKIVDAAYTGATLTQLYDEGSQKDKKGKTRYFKATKPDGLVPGKEVILDRKSLLPGTGIRFVVDIAYNGPANINDSLSWNENKEVVSTKELGADYLDAKTGKVKTDPRNIGNVPIKVTDEAGNELYYIRKLDWVNARFPNTENYRNVVEVITDKEGNEYDNLAIQNEKLMEVRNHIVQNHNVGKETHGITGEKGTGHLILNWRTKKADGTEMEGKIVPDFAFNRKNPDTSLLPDPSLDLVISMGNGVLHSGLNYHTDKLLGFDPKDIILGGVGALVPSPNSQYLYAPLRGQKIYEDGRPSPGLNSIVRAIELYLLNDGTNPSVTAELNNIESNTGFNIGNAIGLRSFINQYYTYTRGFQDSELSPNVEDSDGIERFLFSINDSISAVADKTKHIKLGFSTRGDGAKYANLIAGRLDPVFIQNLQQGLSTRSRAVVFTDPSLQLKGINSTGSFIDSNYVPGKGWQFNQYESYNQYVKSFSQTSVYGRNQLENGQYVYSANPTLGFSIPDIRHAGTLVEENQSPTKVDPVSTPEYEADANLFDEIMSEGPKMVQKTVTAFGTGSEQSQPLTFQNLEKIYNFTPVEQRNGKTIQEVYNDLTTRGHSYLSDGYNPFSRCL